MKIIGLYLKFSFLLSLILTTSRITAQNLPDGIQYKITGRLLMDGGVYLKNPNNFGNGTEFNDLRIGVKATYQNWGMKLEMGYDSYCSKRLLPLNSTDEPGHVSADC